MAARVLLQRRSLAPLATVVLGGMALAPATVFAEAPADKKKPMYDDPEAVEDLPPPVPAKTASLTSLLGPNDASADTKQASKPRGPTPTDRIAVEIGKARLALYKAATAAEDKVNETMDRAFHLEQSFTQTIASLAPPRESGEKIMPGAIYVLVAAMAGSIVTRRSNILLRATVPVAFGVGAGWTVLPVTMRNISDLSWKYEQRFPAVADAHIKTREGIQRGISFAKVHTEVGARYVDDKVTDAREAVEGWVKQGK